MNQKFVKLGTWEYVPIEEYVKEPINIAATWHDCRLTSPELIAEYISMQ